MQQILKDVLIQAGEIDKYFEDTPVNLWRARKKNDVGSLFGMVEEDKILSNGQLRPADITIEIRNGIRWVRCNPSPRGISTFDAPYIFKGSSWEYYKIPKGTNLPNGLAIVRDKFNQRIGATHYTVAPAYDMSLEQFKMLLNQLAILVKKESA